MLVLQGLELLSICKNGFGPFLKLRLLFPFWKAFSNYVFDGHKDVYEYFRRKLLATVRTLAKTLCFTQLCVFFRPSTFFFFFPYLSLLSLPFLHSLHCDCSASARLKKDVFPFLLHNTAI